MNGQPHPAAAAAARPPQPSMSASPAAPQGATPTGVNGQPRPRIRRRPQATDPLRPAQRPLKRIAKPIVPMAKLNHASDNFTGGANAATGSAPITITAAVQQATAQGAQFYPLVISKRQLLEGLRHHVMKLQPPKEKGLIDICDENEFTRPVRLHRRDPRAPPSGAGATFVDDDSPEDIEESKERERQEILKEERRRIKEENQAKIAPSTTKKHAAFQKRTQQIYRADDTPEAQKRAKLRYEEALPWHLEDFDNKQTWVAQYESELSEAHVMIAPESDADGQTRFRMVPIEKWYKFTAKGHRRVVPTDEVVDFKDAKTPKFMANIENKVERMQRAKEEKVKRSGMKTRVGGAGDDDAVPRMTEDGEVVKVEADVDDIDFNQEEDFADDEEGVNGLFEGDEDDKKDAEERLKRDRQGARVFDLVDERKVLEAEEAELETLQHGKQSRKATRKILRKREKRYDDYEDSDSNPYSSSSDSESDSEAERQKEKERAEEEEKKKKAAEKGGEQNVKGKESDKLPSGSSTKGTNTPSGSAKPMDPNKKKRPGSPNLSEASGNESTRKKQKQQHLDTSRKPSLVNMAGTINRGAGSGSESDMPDGRKQKLSMRVGISPTGTPGGSRAASPDGTQVGASRAGSPTGSVAASSQVPAPFPTPQEIYSALPPEGRTINQLLKTFKHRTSGKHDLFIQLVRVIGRFDKTVNLIFPREKMPDEQTFQQIYATSAAAEKKTKKPGAP